MSLKAFHFFFVVVSILFNAFFAFLELDRYRETQQIQDLILGSLGLFGFAVLFYYFFKVREKYKSISYI